MAASSGGVIGLFKKGVILVVGAGVLLAVLRVFNWDPFGIVSFIWDYFSYAANGVADWLTGSAWFRKILSGPK